MEVLLPLNAVVVAYVVYNEFELRPNLEHMGIGYYP